MKRTVPEFRKVKWLTRKGYKKMENRDMRNPSGAVSRIATKLFSQRLRQLYAKGYRYLVVTKGWNTNNHKG